MMDIASPGATRLRIRLGQVSRPVAAPDTTNRGDCGYWPRHPQILRELAGETCERLTQSIVPSGRADRVGRSICRSELLSGLLVIICAWLARHERAAWPAPDQIEATLQAHTG